MDTIPSYPWISEFKDKVQILFPNDIKPLIFLPYVGRPYFPDNESMNIILKYGEITQEFFYIKTRIPLHLQKQRDKLADMLDKIEEDLYELEDLEDLADSVRVEDLEKVNVKKELRDKIIKELQPIQDKIKKEQIKNRVKRPARYIYSSGMLYPYGWKTLYFRVGYSNLYDLVTPKGIHIGMDPTEKALDLAMHKSFMIDLNKEYKECITNCYSRTYKGEYVLLQDSYSNLYYKSRNKKYVQLSNYSIILKWITEIIYILTGLPFRDWSYLEDANYPPYMRALNYPTNSTTYKNFKSQQEVNRKNWKTYCNRSINILDGIFSLNNPDYPDYRLIPLNLPRILYMLCVLSYRYIFSEFYVNK